MTLKLKSGVIKRSGHVAIWMKIKIFQREGTDDVKAGPMVGTRLACSRNQ